MKIPGAVLLLLLAVSLAAVGTVELSRASGNRVEGAVILALAVIVLVLTRSIKRREAR